MNSDCKKLLITCTDLMMCQFLIPHVNYLESNGFDVTIACSNVGNRMQKLKENIDSKVKVYTVSLVRSPFKLQNLRGYSELKKIIRAGHFDIIWTNEPVMGAMTRIAGKTTRMKGAKIVYMAHGFHFYKGAPIFNWLASPIEMYLSKYNDVLITINWEDYNWAKKHLKTKKILHIDGIGINYEKLKCEVSRENKRKELGIKEKELLILSVGELQKRKNHESMIRAVAEISDKNVKYFICGVGNLEQHLNSVVDSIGIKGRVKFLGYRTDVAEIMKAADIYAHPSIREGLGLASLEAMAMGLPLLTSNVQGIPDYVDNGVNGFMTDPNDIEGYKSSIKKLIDDKMLREKMGKKNLEIAKKYDIEKIKPVIKEIFDSVS